jgi:hypothetical protein
MERGPSPVPDDPDEAMNDQTAPDRLCARMTALAWLRSLVLAALLCCPAVAALAGGFAGTFNGISNAAGMVLSLQEADGRLVGRLTAPDGRRFAINGARREMLVNSESDEAGPSGAQGELRLGDAPQAVAFFRLEERPLGVQLLFIPVSGDGRPDMSKARDYPFLKQGVNVSSMQAVAPPPGAGKAVDLLEFIDGYRQWPSRDVARIYESLSERDKGLVQIYDHAGTDILWRVCASNPPNDVMTEAQLAEILDRQQTDCASLTPIVEQARAGGLFPEFLRRARFQFEIIREMALCDRGQSSPTKCADVSALGAPLIAHWRDARSIMLELLPEGTEAATAPKQEPQPETLASVAPAAIEPVSDGAPLPSPRPLAGEAIAPTLPLRASLADDGMAVASGDARDRQGIAGEGRRIARLRRAGLHLPLSNPRS